MAIRTGYGYLRFHSQQLAAFTRNYSGKYDINVTSQETCLFLLTMLSRNEAESGLDILGQEFVNS